MRHTDSLLLLHHRSEFLACGMWQPLTTGLLQRHEPLLQEPLQPTFTEVSPFGALRAAPRIALAQVRSHCSPLGREAAVAAA